MTAETPLAPIAERATAPATLALPTAGGLSWRPATRDDVPAWLLLRHHIARVDAEPFLATLEELEELFDGDWRDMSADSLLGFSTSPADDGALVAWAHVEAPPGDVSQVRAFTWGGVHPDHRGQGIGRELLAWEIGRARQKLAASGKDVPGRIAVFAEDDAPAATLHLYERAGMTPRRYYSDLARPLTGPDAGPVPEVELTGSLRLVPWSTELDEATRLAHNDAFRDHWGSQPQAPGQWTQRAGFAPEWSFVVVDDAPDVDALLASPDTDADTAAALRAGEPFVVGYQLAGRYPDDFAVRGYSFGYTDILGARRAYRGRRIALAALAAGMRAFAADGMEYAALDVDTANPSGAHGLYASLGYVKQSGSRMLSIEL
ncbi:GNAT family N-acetyltransferase [Promicromonospora citrea]|uniref:Putative acetyltransferase, GNAT n=1 Tax=Promicromonospora citrea TaxID=43677 RepID=A0A8H9L3S4_9MICO|nr:GNAT family N-acetyltransferase [Promicromonospora citrea]NNH51408.1 GNAT family N-acetyltransferase [Promicromonospora citrea]GGM23130.1 putative acetyltransferase, GNAT [Promicromonospora citrea]